MNQFPKGATHVADDERFYMQQDGLWYFWSHLGTWRRHWSGKPVGAVTIFGTPVEESPTWVGVDLPPVGTVCEHQPYDDREDWHMVEIIAHKNASLPVAVFWDDVGHRASYSSYEAFRPLRTPEQIAAEEREKAIECIQKDLHCSRAMAEDIFDAGYHK